MNSCQWRRLPLDELDEKVLLAPQDLRVRREGDPLHRLGDPDDGVPRHHLDHGQLDLQEGEPHPDARPRALAEAQERVPDGEGKLFCYIFG